MRFRDRLSAADLLAEKLRGFAAECPLVLGIPRGAAPMACRVAERLGGDFDVLLVHKIGAPGDAEFAVGSVSEFGDVHRTAPLGWLSDRQLAGSARAEIERLRDKRRAYAPVRAPLPLEGRTVIIVDDGLATGSTMLAAARAARARKPRRLVIAAPVASAAAIELLTSEADQVVVLTVPEDFFSISQFYESFPQVDDAEVLRLLSAPLRR